MWRKEAPVAFVPDLEGNFSRDVAALRLLDPSIVAQHSILIIPDTAGGDPDLLDMPHMLALLPSCRLLFLWLDPDVDVSAIFANQTTSILRAHQLSNLRTLCLHENLPTQVVVSILSHTPRLQELEVAPDIYAVDQPLGTSSDRPYPSYPFRLQRLSYFGYDSRLFCHLFALSRRTLSWLALHNNSSPDVLHCLEEGNCVQYLFFTFSSRDGTLEPSVAYRVVAAFPRLTLLMLRAAELSSFPGLLSRCGAPLRRLVLLCSWGSIYSSFLDIAETLGSLLRDRSPAVQQLREIAFRLDPTFDYEYGLHESLAELHTACTNHNIRISARRWDSDPDEFGHGEGVLAFFARLAA